MNGAGTWAIVLGYLLGSVPVGPILAAWSGRGDLRRLGSGNTGATNAFRVAGPAIGVATLALDLGKGAVTVLVAQRWGPPGSAVPHAAALAAIAGHIWPPWQRLRGGKGAATGAGGGAILDPATSFLSLAVFLGVATWTRRVSAGTIAACAAFPLLSAAAGRGGRSVMFAVCASALILWSHRANMQRLRAGTEEPFPRDPGPGASDRERSPR